MPHATFPQHLKEGYEAFRAGRLQAEREKLAELAEKGQRPKTMIVGCCDSRATPEMIFDAGPGELFVVRNVANLVPSYNPDGDYNGTPAALEFAMHGLNVQHIVVLGHGRCGGIKAFLNNDHEPMSPGDFIGKWMTLIQPASEHLNPEKRPDLDKQGLLERAGIINSLINIRTYPGVTEMEDSGKLTLHGAWFDIANGELELYDAAEKMFVPLLKNPLT